MKRIETCNQVVCEPGELNKVIGYGLKDRGSILVYQQYLFFPPHPERRGKLTTTEFHLLTAETNLPTSYQESISKWMVVRGSRIFLKVFTFSPALSPTQRFIQLVTGKVCRNVLWLFIFV